MQLEKVGLYRGLFLAFSFCIAKAVTRHHRGIKMRQQRHNSKLCEKKPTLTLSSFSQY